MSFQFRLQTLLELRARTRDTARQNLADALAAQREIDARRNEVSGDIREHEDRSRQLATGRINVAQLNRQRHYLTHLGQTLRDSEKEAAEVAKVVEQRQNELAIAEQEVRLLEKLRDKQSEEFYRGQEKKAELQREEAWLNSRSSETPS